MAAVPVVTPTPIINMNVGDAQSSFNANDEVKEAVKAVVEELLEEKMEAVINRLEEKIENATKGIDVKKQIKDLTLLINYNQQELKDLLNAQQQLSSCKNLPPTSPSGYYWIYNSTGDLNYEFCDMTRKCGCNGTGGWMRVANFDMTDTSQQCPDGLRLITSPKHTCGRVTPTIGCASIVYPTNGHKYSYMCGRIKAYQYGQPEAFSTASDNWLADGITLYTRTHGELQHIWSFVVGRDEVSTGAYVCPCNVGHSGITVNTTIGQDYFCDTGSETAARQVFYSGDPLWDGAGCGPRSTCCSFNNRATLVL